MIRNCDYSLNDIPDMRAEIAGARERGEFWLAWQPIVDRHDRAEHWTSKVHGAEVLLRWRHPLLGDVAPASFVPMLEESGQIHAVGEWVLRTACTQVRRWQAEGLELQHLSVNVSPNQFHDPDFYGRVRSALEESGLEPGTLSLEVTENILIHNTEWIIAGLKSLAEFGIGLHIDDFGTGFASIAYLKRLPLTALKIDRSFLSEIESDPRDRELVRWMIQLGEIFGLETIAEGVESLSAAQTVIDLGIDRLQGFAFGPGVDAEQFRHRYLRQTCRLT